jgi:hypothetical protein
VRPPVAAAQRQYGLGVQRKLSAVSALRSWPMTKMSVWRRMMLWSESWNVSTRLRPRSLAALQAISAVASACASELSEPEIGATPMLTETS